MAGSSITQGDKQKCTFFNGMELYKIPITFTADDTDQSIPTIEIKESGYFIGIAYKAGATAPAAMVAAITDELDNELLDVATALVSGQREFSAFDKPVPFIGGITLALTGNTVNSATGTIDIYFM
ncbi:MAG: hypothetical protein PVG39_00795 [Desulfobacteraceae bacterium]|jgi:hypothetical protein